MTKDFTALDDWVLALLDRLEPQARRTVNRKVAYALRRSQAQRIASQQNPDGTQYQARSKAKGLRTKKGSIKRKAMFARLRTQRFLKVGADADGLEVGFRGRAAYIAEAHQFGSQRRDRRGRVFVTPRRELLGLTDREIQIIIDTYLEQLNA